jgi:hypothetical protein
MNMFVATLVALVALSSVADATIVIGTTAAATTTTLTSASLASLGILGGVAILKGILIAGLAARSKRSAENSNDAAFAILTNAEPAQCYRRLICDMAAGAIADNDKILRLFNDEVSPVSPKFEYVTAAKVGKIVKNASQCEIRYSCPLNTLEIAKVLA